MNKDENTKFVFMLILISMAFSFISCTDEDDKVEIPQLVG